MACKTMASRAWRFVAAPDACVRVVLPFRGGGEKVVWENRPSSHLQTVGSTWSTLNRNPSLYATCARGGFCAVRSPCADRDQHMSSKIEGKSLGHSDQPPLWIIQRTYRQMGSPQNSNRSGSIPIKIHSFNKRCYTPRILIINLKKHKFFYRPQKHKSEPFFSWASRKPLRRRTL